MPVMLKHYHGIRHEDDTNAQDDSLQISLVFLICRDWKVKKK